MTDLDATADAPAATFTGWVRLRDGAGNFITWAKADLRRDDDGPIPRWGGVIEVSRGSAVSRFGSKLMIELPDGRRAFVATHPVPDEEEPPDAELLRVVGVDEPPF